MDSSIASSVKNLLNENRTSDALALLLQNSRPNQQVHAAIQTVLGDFNDLTAQRLRGTIDDMEATQRLHNIHDKIIIALDAFDSEGQPLPDSVFINSGKMTKYFSDGSLYMIAFILLAASVCAVIGFGKEAIFILMMAGYYVLMGALLATRGWLVLSAVRAIKSR